VTLAALSIAVFAAVAFDVASYSFATSLHAWVKDGIAGDMILRPSGSGGTFDENTIVRVRATPGVTGVTAIRTIHTLAGTTDVAVRGEDAPIPRVMMTEPPADVGAPLAAALHLKSGDIIMLRTAHADLPVRVNAIHPDFSEPQGAIVIARHVLRQAFHDDRIDAIRLTMTKNTTPTELANRLARRLAPQRIVTTSTRAIRDRFTRVFDRTFAFVHSLAIVVVAIAAIGVASALCALILERRFELRMLRTLGTPRATIMRMLLIEALAVAIFGSALGIVMGLAFAAAQLYVADPVAIGFAIPLAVPSASVASVFVAAVVASVIAPLVVAPAAFRIAADRSR
jgi:hypothetical protein